MRRIEQRNKAKKLADTERTKNNSEEKGGKKTKRRDDQRDRARGRNETDTSRGMEKGKEDGRRGSIRSRWQAASGGTCGRMARGLEPSRV